MYSRDRKPLREWGWFEVLCALVGVLLGLLLAVILEPERVGAAEPGWTWPLAPAPQVVRAFDPPAHRYSSGHRGADLAGSPGAPVLAAGAGHVTYAGLLAGRGVVVVSHGALRTTYEPVTAAVAVGQAVIAGQALGTLDAGHAGCPTAACLHWGLRRGESYLDPVQLVDPGPVRLLPVAPAADAGPLPAPAVPGPVQRSSAGPAAPAPAGSAPEPTVDEPTWSLRAADAPLGAAAVAALAAGLVLLARPRQPPDGPATAPAGAPARPGPAPPASADRVADRVVPVDLSAERLRRRVG